MSDSILFLKTNVVYSLLFPWVYCPMMWTLHIYYGLGLENIQSVMNTEHCGGKTVTNGWGSSFPRLRISLFWRRVSHRVVCQCGAGDMSLKQDIYFWNYSVNVKLFPKTERNINMGKLCLNKSACCTVINHCMPSHHSLGNVLPSISSSSYYRRIRVGTCDVTSPSVKHSYSFFKASLCEL